MAKAAKKSAAKKAAKKGAPKKGGAKRSAAKKAGAKRGAKKGGAKKSAARKGARKKGASKRELIAPRGDKRFVRRDKQGQFNESDDAGRSLGRDVKKSAKTKVKAGQGDRGDQKS